MKTIFSLSTLLLATAALAGQASAQDIRVSLAGKSPATVEADINQAAKQVCASAVRSGDVGFFEMRDCVSTVAADAMQQAARVLKPA